jgi:hypothetical protein
MGRSMGSSQEMKSTSGFPKNLIVAKLSMIVKKFTLIIIYFLLLYWGSIVII